MTLNRCLLGDRSVTGASVPREARGLRPTWTGPSERRHAALYLVIGASAAIIDVALFAAGHRILALGEVAANVVSVHVAIAWSFAINARLNFRVRSSLGKRFLLFYSVALLGLAVSTAILYWLSVERQFHPDLVKVASMPLILCLQYALNRAVTFSGGTQVLSGTVSQGAEARARQHRSPRR